MRTIEQLNTLLEELEKRIRNISTAQSTLAQINAICTYISNVQDYLQELQTTFENHVSECDDYTDDINNLQTQIDAINESINNLISDDETINQIQSKLDELQTELNNFIGNSSATCESLENDISALQSDLGSCQDDISSIETEISAINSSIGEQNTTITNLQTTQTNLQTTQSSQASTINNINSRLTTAENNISTLTGGVDITGYENRLKDLEPVNNLFQSYVHKHYNFHNATPENFTLYTREYTYTCKPNAFVYQEFKISYEFSGEGTMTVALYENNVATGEVYAIDLAQNPTECTLHRNFYSSTRSHNIMLKCVAPSAITYKTVDITMHGQDLFIFEDNQDLKAVCFNNYIYITRYYDDCVKYGKFLPTDTIDIENLPNSRPYHDAIGCNNFLIYSAIPLFSFAKVYDDSFLKICSNNNYSYCVEDSAGIDSTQYFNITQDHSYSNDIVIGNYKYVLMPAIQNSQTVLKSPTFNTSAFEFENMVVNDVSEWLYAGLLIDNFYTQDMESLDAKKMGCIAFGDDGYMYLLKNRRTNPHACKICKGGIYATAYMQQDQTINVYICFGNYVEKYQIVPTNEKYQTCNFVEKINDCFCVYELINGNTIYKTNTGWVLNVVEETTSEEETTLE